MEIVQLIYDIISFYNKFLNKTMFDWFDEPIVYYRRFAPMRSGVFDYMSRWMDSVDKAMEQEFGDFYDSFNVPSKQQTIKHEEEKNCEKKETDKEVKEDKKQDKDEKVKTEEEEESEPQYYSCISRMYSGSDGVQHIYREESDSKTGKKKVVETRRIGNKSMTLHRVTDKDGKVEEHETRKNIKDDEVDEFKKQWISHNVPVNTQLPEPENKNRRG